MEEPLEDLFLQLAALDQTATLSYDGGAWGIGLDHDNMGPRDLVYGSSMRDAIMKGIARAKDIQLENRHG